LFRPHEEILPEDISEEDAERILKKLATEIVNRRLTAPAIFLLESCSPLSFIGSQAMIALEPFIHAIFDLPDYRKFALLMERRGNVQRLITMIEIANHEQKLASKEERKKRGRRWLRSKSKWS
jgi:hypothetical protein